MKELYLQKLKEEFVPALGCTEPVAVAYAAAKAREILNQFPDRIEFHVSGNIFKNGMGVGIPGSGMVGLTIAGALGALGGNPKAGLEVLDGISPDIVELAQTFVNQGKVQVDVKYGVAKLYIECICFKGENSGRVIIQDRHTNVVLAERNGFVIYQNTSKSGIDAIVSMKDWNFRSIYEFINAVDIADIAFIEKGVKLNKSIAEEGLKGNYGLQVGKSMMINIRKGILKEDLMSRSIMLTAAASDARMAGSAMPVMSNCGSGNQGISVTLPVVVAAEEFKVSNEKLLRALALALLVTIYMKSFVGQLSALCGVLLSTAGAGCGITYIMGGDFKQMGMTLQNMTGGVTGMICDGAKYGCSHKIAASVSAAIQSSLLAMNHNCLNGMNGIIDDDVEATIRNIGRLANEGMEVTDEVILKTMLEKMKKVS
ncbi:L-serine ammonia-lyase, iron-sulfur-dependent, subunit alpha [Labilibaculum sp. K2S]|uniref:L-cysteine desulfidase family protein n=1 Tax=Labilibaculum sp. K2S TaxID=3056386 RepID=UPI0025A326E8|nr:L-serine ammonia-lyase, iron-sulfur-dependent, subunit alpha [Labilibaculum sp. K2S]MDM8158469.1 L-serine ammonia-lyase, iron-sulfur-dependent, subunit alpha [Labilibaculum sp. K2S]